MYSGGSRISPRCRREPSKGGVILPNSPKNCMKLKEFGRPPPPLDAPMMYGCALDDVQVL